LLTDTATSTRDARGLVVPDFGVVLWTASGLRGHRSKYVGLYGREIRVAVLDTGLDTDHPDFKGREIVAGQLRGR
jgi:subtilisin family serine protease